MPKRIGDREQPCLTLILLLIYFNQPSLFLTLEITFSYNLTATTLNLKGTLSSSNLFHRLVLGTVSKDFLKSTKQQRRLILSLQHSSTMILKVTRYSIVKWYPLSPTWPLALYPWISSYVSIFFSKIIPHDDFEIFSSIC
jgi:hypothetical protein